MEYPIVLVELPEDAPHHGNGWPWAFENGTIYLGDRQGYHRELIAYANGAISGNWHNVSGGRVAPGNFGVYGLGSNKVVADMIKESLDEYMGNNSELFREAAASDDFRVGSKIVEVETEVGLGGRDIEYRRPVVYDPNTDTMYVGSPSSSHASVHAVVTENFLDKYPHTKGYTTDIEWADWGYWEYYDYGNGEKRVETLVDREPTPEQVEQLKRISNIYDPVEEKLDKHVFKDDEPRESVVNFIKRLYYRAIKEEYGIDTPEAFIDLYITGSLTTYQYSETSDCDVSVFPNYERFAKAFGENSGTTRKRLVSLSIEHIDGTFLPGTLHPLQFFVVPDGIELNDLYQPGLRSAWSITDEMWIVAPEKERSHVVPVEFPDAYSRASSMASKMKDALDHAPEQAREMWKMVHKKRQLDQQAGLGDYSEGNIVYKWLLHEGLFERIRNELGEHIAKVSYNDKNEIRWGYNGETGDVIAVKAWDTAELGLPFVTHLDMVRRWQEGFDWSIDKGRNFPTYFFGYAKWNPEFNTVEDIEVSSLDVTRQEGLFGPGDLAIVKEKITEQAREFMPKYAAGEWTVIEYSPEDVRAEDEGRGELGYPMVQDRRTNTIHIGPIGSHHRDIFDHLNPLDEEDFDDVEWLNLWPPETFGGSLEKDYYQGMWVLNQYGGQPVDPEVFKTIEEWFGNKGTLMPAKPRVSSWKLAMPPAQMWQYFLEDYQAAPPMPSSQAAKDLRGFDWEVDIDALSKLFTMEEYPLDMRNLFHVMYPEQEPEWVNHHGWYEQHQIFAHPLADLETANRILWHEIQHAYQDQEGAMDTSNYDDTGVDEDLYWKHPIEEDARAFADPLSKAVKLVKPASPLYDPTWVPNEYHLGSGDWDENLEQWRLQDDKLVPILEDQVNLFRNHWHIWRTNWLPYGYDDPREEEMSVWGKVSRDFEKSDAWIYDPAEDKLYFGQIHRFILQEQMGIEDYWDDPKASEVIYGQKSDQGWFSEYIRGPMSYKFPEYEPRIKELMEEALGKKMVSYGEYYNLSKASRNETVESASGWSLS